MILRIEKEGDSERWCYGRKRISECCSTNNKNYERGFLSKPSLLFLFCKQLQCTNRARDHSGHYPVQYFYEIDRSQTMQIVFQTLGAKILENGAKVDMRGYFASCLLKTNLTLYLKLKKLLET